MSYREYSNFEPINISDESEYLFARITVTTNVGLFIWRKKIRTRIIYKKSGAVYWKFIDDGESAYVDNLEEAYHASENFNRVTNSSGYKLNLADQKIADINRKMIGSLEFISVGTDIDVLKDKS